MDGKEILTDLLCSLHFMLNNFVLYRFLYTISLPIFIFNVHILFPVISDSAMMIIENDSHENRTYLINFKLFIMNNNYLR